MARSPRQLANLKPFTSETAGAFSRQRWQPAQRAPEQGSANDGAIILPKKVPSPMPEAGWGVRQSEDVYISKAFPREWQAYYRRRYRDLKKQYGASRHASQYLTMIERIASLSTRCAILETTADSEAARYLLLRTEKQLQDYIGQLQRYTEAEKREIEVTQTIVSTTLAKVIAIGEATILEPTMRAAFMSGLRSLVTGEAISEDLKRLPSGGQSLDNDVIQGEVREAEPTVIRETTS
jgi:hypothetical protein